MSEKSQSKSGPPRVLHIDPDSPFVMDRARIYATLNGLMRHDIQDCTTLDLDHTAELLARLVALDELSTVPVGAMLDRMIHEFNKQQLLSQFLKGRYQRSVAAGAAKEFTDAMIEAHTEGGAGLDISLVKLYQKEHGGSEEAAMRAVARSLAGHELAADPNAVDRRFDALKKKIQRSKKTKTR